MGVFIYVHPAFYFSTMMKLIFHASVFASIIYSLAVQRSNSAENNPIYVGPNIERRTIILDKKEIMRTKLLKRLDADMCSPGVLCSGTLPLSRLIFFIDTIFPPFVDMNADL